MSSSLIAVVLSILLAAGAFPAQEPELPSAAEILDRHVEATGGAEAQLALTTRVRKGKLAVDLGGHAFEAQVVEHLVAPDKSHVVLDGDSFSQVTVCDGRTAWKWRAGPADGDREADSGVTSLLEGQEKERALEAARLHAAVEWRAQFTGAETVGVADVLGRPAYEVRVTNRAGESYSQFYDVESGRLVERHRSAPGHGGELDMEVFFEDYREHGGIWTAMKVRAELRSPSLGEGSQIWTYASLEHDVKVASSLFELPEALRAASTEQAD